ncbi:MAG: PQQ-binding-like beta-propeller repeat protein [Halorientalis sp.]
MAQALPSFTGSISGAPPIVHRGSVYVGHVDQTGLYALDARDGGPRWQYQTKDSINQAALGFQNGVFASTGDVLLAFDLRGHKQWTYRTGSDRMSNSSPAIGGGKVLYTTEIIGSVVGIEPDEAGASEWRFQRDVSFGLPTVATGTAYIPARGRDSDRIVAVDVGDRRRDLDDDAKSVRPGDRPVD